MADPALRLPHAPPALLLTRVLEADERTVRALGRISSDAPGATAAGAPVVLGVELGAQCAAQLDVGAEAAAGGTEAGVGYLVSIRGARFAQAFLPVDQDLEVEARRLGGAGGLDMFEIVVRAAGGSEPSVVATLSTLVAGRREAVGGRQENGSG